ncbi:MAG: hypothetical protein L7V86_10025 [Verrucomicrobiales bacterium]|nr:hypothetical protein [Verrucomicrobiales bacterium]
MWRKLDGGSLEKVVHALESAPVFAGAEHFFARAGEPMLDATENVAFIRRLAADRILTQT